MTGDMDLGDASTMQDVTKETAPVEESRNDQVENGTAESVEDAKEPVGEEAEEEATLGSTPVKAETNGQQEQEQAPSTEAIPQTQEPEPSSPEPEPEVLPVLSIGLPLRVASLGTAPNLRRTSSTPVMQTTSSTPTMTDRSAPELVTTELPSFATPSPMVSVRLPNVADIGIGSKVPPSVIGGGRSDGMVLGENSKSKQFNQRLDYMVGEFFTRQVAKLATSTPESVDRMHKILTQRVREKLGQQVGKQWAHVTAQPEVDEAAKEIDSMYQYFSQLEKMVEKQRAALQQLNEVEAELSLFYQQKGYQEGIDEIGKNLVHLGQAYHQECKERMPVIASLDAYLAFIKTFRAKAINDSRDTVKSQKTARQEFDSYASKLGYLEEKTIRSAQKVQPMPFNPLRSKSSEDTIKYQERELDQTRTRFQAAKTRYQVLSTQVIDKAGLLEMKRGVDFGAYVEKVVEAHDAYLQRHGEPLKRQGEEYNGQSPVAEDGTR